MASYEVDSRFITYFWRASHLFLVHTGYAERCDLEEEVLNQWGLILSSFVYGVHMVLAVLGLQQVLKRPHRKQRFLLGFYLLLLFCFATVAFVLQACWTQVAFIYNRSYPGGPTQFLLDNVRSSLNQAVTAMYLGLSWLSDGIILHRFRVLWACSYLPDNRRVALAFVIPIALALLITGGAFFHSISGLGVNLWGASSATLGIAYLALCLCVNTMLTCLIIARLWYLRRQLTVLYDEHGSGHGDVYTSVAAMIIDSASLYTAVALLTVIACGVSSPMQYVLLPMLGQFQAIPPLLIISRVASGSALSQRIFHSLVHLPLRHKRSRAFSDTTAVRFASRRGSAGSSALPSLSQPPGIHIDREVECFREKTQIAGSSSPLWLMPWRKDEETQWSECPHDIEKSPTDNDFYPSFVEKSLAIPEPILLVDR